jgi:DHA1 family tetracycline resistance protein-like MFS transporter
LTGEHARAFSMAPLLFEGFACTMSLIAFVAVIGPISRLLQLEPWQVGVAITSAGVAWTVMARWWARQATRMGAVASCSSVLPALS